MKFFPAICLLLLLASCDEPVPTRTGTEKIIPRKTTVVAPAPPNPYMPVDLSPMDVSYFPPDYPILKTTKKTTAPPVARVIYSRPHKHGRKIFGALLKWGEPWRLGANEATEIEFFRPVTIQKKRIRPGRYVLYAIPQEKTWTVVFNSGNYSWGLKQDASKDLYRFEVPVQPTTSPVENFTMVFEKASAGAGGNLVIAWDDTEARLPFQL
ncbi:DUF2911 domain-containing protein [Paraflavisolibacter sp. H34]|uniref:DUF2911 domain-containing protein n=1 Tax=Huijunlia imazamoxiresistens TaxID=3127457 RepID=UPI003015E573